jgi:hypothetical protein
MDKKWLFIIIIFSVLGLVLVGLVFIYFRNKEITTNKTKTILTLPEELSTNFDPTINTPIFEISFIDEDKKTLGLIMIFPENYDPKEITSLISCQEQDVKVLRNEKEVGEGLAPFFIEVEKGLGTPMTLSGLCSDQACNEINKQCQLNLQ